MILSLVAMIGSEKMLHNICISAVAISLRLVGCGPLVLLTSYIAVDKMCSKVRIFIHPFEKLDVLCYGVWRPSVNFFVSG